MIKDIFLSNRVKITCTYFLLLFEFVIFAIAPFLLGKAVDGLLEKDNGSFITYLLLLLVALFIGFFRRVYDTRVYSSIWGDRVKQTVKGLKQREVSQPKIISRYRLLYIYSDFFEYTIPNSLASFVEIIVAFFMIGFVVPIHIFFALFGLTFVSMLFYYILSFRIQKVDFNIQHLKEKIDAEIIDKEAAVDVNIDDITQQYIKKSDLEAAGWGLNDVCCVIAEVIVVLTIIAENQTTGTIMATLTYVWKLFTHTGCFSYYFNHKKQIEMADEFLNKD